MIMFIFSTVVYGILIYHQLEDSFDEIVNSRKRRPGSIPSVNVAPTYGKATRSSAASVNSDHSPLRAVPDKNDRQQPEEGGKPSCKKVSF